MTPDDLDQLRTLLSSARMNGLPYCDSLDLLLRRLEDAGLFDGRPFLILTPEPHVVEQLIKFGLTPEAALAEGVARERQRVGFVPCL